MTSHRHNDLAFVACGVFERELHEVVSRLYPDAFIHFTSPSLDTHPQLLASTLERLLDAHADAGKIVLVLGRCIPDIDALVHRKGISRVEGGSCYEILLGKTFHDIINEERGSYFLTPYLCLNFRVAVAEPLRLDSPLLRERLFKRYTRLILIDTGCHGRLEEAARSVSSFLGLPVRILRIGLDEFEKRIVEAVKKS